MARATGDALRVIALEPGELPEQVGHKLGGQATAVVGDGEGDVDPFQHDAHTDPRGFRRVPGGVVQEVHQHLDDAAPVRHDAGQVRLQVDVDRVPGSSAEEGVPGLVHQDGGIRGFGGHRQSPGLDAGHVQEVGDEGAHLVMMRATRRIDGVSAYIRRHSYTCSGVRAGGRPGLLPSAMARSRPALIRSLVDST